jgi:hypothetical protein
MMKKSRKCCNPTGTTGNDLPPHWGEKTKQMKVTSAKESETKGSWQTKLLFLRTDNNISPPTSISTIVLKVITPEDYMLEPIASVPQAHQQTPKGHKLLQTLVPKILQQRQLPKNHPNLRVTL